jgi:hypothetical protein
MNPPVNFRCPGGDRQGALLARHADELPRWSKAAYNRLYRANDLTSCVALLIGIGFT